MLIQAQFRDLDLGTCIPQRDPLFICPFGVSYCGDSPLNVSLPFFLNETTCVTGNTVISYYGFDNLEVHTFPSSSLPSKISIKVWEDAVILGSLLVGFSLFGWIVMHWRVSRPVG
jgi:hypothetical protein